jgi:hypothetical protein
VVVAVGWVVVFVMVVVDGVNGVVSGEVEGDVVVTVVDGAEAEGSDRVAGVAPVAVVGAGSECEEVIATVDVGAAAGWITSAWRLSFVSVEAGSVAVEVRSGGRTGAGLV